MRIVNLSRFIIFLTIVTFMFSFAVSMLNDKVFSASAIEYENIVVSEGDTLWSIAMNINGDVNKNVHIIKKINNIKSSIIYPGQELKIPVIENIQNVI